MKIKDYERAKVASEAGLAINNDGVVYCPQCGQNIKFNGGATAIFHEDDCSKESPQYFSLPHGPRAGLSIREAYKLGPKYKFFK